MPIVNCGICLKEFYIKPSHKIRGWGKFCSINCRSKAQLKGKVVKCSVCNKSIYRPPRAIAHSKSGKYFCSKSCQTLWRNSFYSGDKSIKWINGIHAYRNILARNGKKPICGLCGNADNRLLNVHHRDHERTNNKIENLCWLCLNCHYLVHNDKVEKQKFLANYNRNSQ